MAFVIIGGVDINNYSCIRSRLPKDDFVLFCDSVLKHMDYLWVNPSLIVGDFDAYMNPMLDIETIVFPCKKDDTDTGFAVKDTIKRVLPPRRHNL